jgi:hypothetical protein
VGDGEWFLSSDWAVVHSLTARDGFRYQEVVTVCADIREKMFQLVADSRQVRQDRTGLDMVAHEDNIEAEGVRGRSDW